MVDDDPHDGQELLAAAARQRATSMALQQSRSALDGIAPGPTGPWTPWNIAAIAMGLLLITGSLVAVSATPRPQKIGAVTVRFLDGPRVPEAEILAWIRRFPFRQQLANPNEWTLHQLAEHLKGWSAVESVPLVRLVHQRGPVPVVRRGKDGRAVTTTMEGLRRVLEVSVALREPYLPGVLEDGSRVWIDRDGRVLPGILPRPEVQRPVVRGLRAGGPEALAAATHLWSLLEPQIERGLITDIVLAEPLDHALPASPRGIVLRTRTGGRIVWGAPGEERFGVSVADKVANLVHTLRCQGDMTRLAMVNVRFKEPVYTLR